MTFSRFAQCALIVCFCLALSACGSQAPQRTIADIDRELQSLPRLYIVEKSGKEIIAPWSDTGYVMDPDTNDVAFLARYCTKSDCPNKDKGQDGRPSLFVWSDPLLIIPTDGSKPTNRREPPPGESHDDFVRRMGGYIEPTCPGCVAKRNLKGETSQVRTQYSDAVKEYIPPESVKRREELEAERKAWFDNIKIRPERKMNPDAK